MRLRKLRVALLCATFLYPASEAQAEPISTAIGLTTLIAGGLGVSAATAGVIGGIVITGAVSVGSTLISNSLRSNPDSVGPETPVGVQGQMSAGAVMARNRVFGKMAIDGKLEYWRAHAANNAQLQLVISLASGPHDLFGIIDDGKPVTLETLGPNFYGINERKWSANGAHTAYVRFYHGFYDQEADTDLIAAADPANPWTENHRGRGVCYAMVNMIYIPDVYPNGIPKFQFVIGARVYDRRKDSTNGGSGSHRWGDQHTWEFNDNVSVGLYEFERGLTIGGQRVLGRHLAPVDIVSDYFVGAANICDEQVPLKEGGTEPRYRIGMNVGADRDLVSVERDFCTAMAGQLLETIGAYGPVPGVAQAAAMTFTDDDLVDGKEVRYSQKKSRSELVNTVYGAFSDPEQNYQPAPYAPRFSDDDAAADGGPFVVQRDVLMIPSETQAQRVIEHLRREARLQGTATVTLKHKFSPLESGDWVRWISARRQFDKYFKIVQHSLGEDRTITLALKEISAGVFGWDESTDQLDPLNPVSLPGYGAPLLSVPDFTAFQRQILGAGGLVIPAVHCQWSPIFDRTVDSVVVQYRVGTDDTTSKVAPPFDPQNGEGNLTDGIQASTGYQVRAIITTTPPRAVAWTNWFEVTAPSQHIVPTAAAVTDHSIILASLGSELDARIRQVDNQFNGILARLRLDQTSIVSSVHELVTNLREVIGRTRIALGVRYEQNSASITETRQVLADAQQAIAAIQLLLETEFATNDSVATAKAEAISTAASNATAAIAAFAATLDATYATDASVATAKSEAISTAQSNANSAIAAFAATLDATYATDAQVTSAKNEAISTATANADSALSAFIQSIFATSGAGTAQGKIRFIASSAAAGAVASYAIELNVGAGWRPSGLYLDDYGTFSRFRVIVDQVQMMSPGVNGGAPFQMFSLDNIDGQPVAVLNALTYIQKVVTNSIQTKHIVGASISVADAASVGANNGNGAWQTLATVTLQFDDTINGSKIPIYPGGLYHIHKGSGLVIEVQVSLNGGLIYYHYELSNGDFANIPIACGSYITGNGGTAFATLELQFNAAPGSFIVPGSVITGAGFKR